MPQTDGHIHAWIRRTDGLTGLDAGTMCIAGYTLFTHVYYTTGLDLGHDTREGRWHMAAAASCQPNQY